VRARRTGRRATPFGMDTLAGLLAKEGIGGGRWSLYDVIAGPGEGRSWP
jgi:hypothetical protein